MATIAAAVGAELPANAAEDSFNLLPAFVGKPGPGRDAVVHQSSAGQLAVRQGPWKLITALPKRGNPEAELYNLTDDPAETKNVHAGHPEIAERLAALLEKYRREGRSRP